MIELTEEQAQAIAVQGTPLEVWNSKTRERFLLVRRDALEADITGTALDADADVAKTALAPNLRLLDALAQVDRIQVGMQPKADGASQDFLRQARAGELYDWWGDRR